MNQQRGSTLVGFIIGLVVGLGIALGVAVYVTKVPIPFMNKGQTARLTKTPQKLRRTKIGTRTRLCMARKAPSRPTKAMRPTSPMQPSKSTPKVRTPWAT